MLLGLPWFLKYIKVSDRFYCNFVYAISKKQLLYTCYIQFPYLFLDPCICMEMYFEAMRFVSILLDFSKNKMYTGVF